MGFKSRLSWKWWFLGRKCFLVGGFALCRDFWRRGPSERAFLDLISWAFLAVIGVALIVCPVKGRLYRLLELLWIPQPGPELF